MTSTSNFEAPFAVATDFPAPESTPTPFTTASPTTASQLLGIATQASLVIDGSTITSALALGSGAPHPAVPLPPLGGSSSPTTSPPSGVQRTSAGAQSSLISSLKRAQTSGAAASQIQHTVSSTERVAYICALGGLLVLSIVACFVMWHCSRRWSGTLAGESGDGKLLLDSCTQVTCFLTVLCNRYLVLGLSSSTQSRAECQVPLRQH